ncbi:MAG: hypothetical protein LBI96_01765 [Odoribacteraceae bacterium]|jgi:peptidoglycan hydrolase-like amidase|nr:hypothetical protein [Odoribacteraceae bacterium]
MSMKPWTWIPSLYFAQGLPNVIVVTLSIVMFNGVGLCQVCAAVMSERGYDYRQILARYFRGAGWGHGVGLCQVGAAVMSERGYNYRQILARYFPGALLETFI